jgi:hypothetical protein
VANERDTGSDFRFETTLKPDEELFDLEATMRNQRQDARRRFLVREAEQLVFTTRRRPRRCGRRSQMSHSRTYRSLNSEMCSPSSSAARSACPASTAVKIASCCSASRRWVARTFHKRRLMILT